MPTTDSVILTLLVGMVLSPLLDLVMAESWTRPQKTLFAALASVVAGFAAAAYEARGMPADTDVVGAVALVWGWVQATYQVSKGAGVSPNLRRRTMIGRRAERAGGQ